MHLIKPNQERVINYICHNTVIKNQIRNQKGFLYVLLFSIFLMNVSSEKPCDSFGVAQSKIYRFSFIHILYLYMINCITNPISFYRFVLAKYVIERKTKNKQI